ncbi:hypothetical protein [Streptomyces sp. Ru72]|uniref:hypothetical protein n=1 Tax=Streptomyces sp. Ru72 TaxID=2080747 RepID=UPI001CA48067
MIARGIKGSIVNIGSMWAHQAIAATPSSAYSMAKAALHSLTEHLPWNSPRTASGSTRSLPLSSVRPSTRRPSPSPTSTPRSTASTKIHFGNRP